MAKPDGIGETDGSTDVIAPDVGDPLTASPAGDWEMVTAPVAKLEGEVLAG